MADLAGTVSVKRLSMEFYAFIADTVRDEGQSCKCRGTVSAPIFFKPNIIQMADIIRTAESGDDWTQKELTSYNISVVEQPFPTFFGAAHLPELPQSPHPIRTFCETEDRRDALDNDAYKLLHYLDLAHPGIGREAAVDNLAERLLEILGYADGRHILVMHQTLPFIVCGMKCSAQTNISVLDGDNIILFVLQEDKGLDIPDDPEPQLIAEAIAAFQRNNFTRERLLHLPTLDVMVFPGITLCGTFPTFYKIRVTRELSDAVIRGTFPSSETIVLRHIPRLPGRNSEGMKPLDSRRVIVQYFQAFKRFVTSIED